MMRQPNWKNPDCQKLIWGFLICFDGHCLNYSSMFNNIHSLEVLEVIFVYLYSILQSVFDFITHIIFIYYYSYLYSILCICFLFVLEITKPFSKWSCQSQTSKKKTWAMGVSCLRTKHEILQKQNKKQNRWYHYMILYYFQSNEFKHTDPWVFTWVDSWVIHLIC